MEEVFVALRAVHNIIIISIMVITVEPSGYALQNQPPIAVAANQRLIITNLFTAQSVREIN